MLPAPLLADVAAAHPYGWWSLVPPLVAIALAILTQRVVLSLLLGLAAGALVLAGGQPLAALINLCEHQLWPTLIEPAKLRVTCFTALVGATIGVVYQSGGMKALVELLAPLARGRRSGQITVWLGGLVIFFDDYANCLLLGNTFRGLCDKLRISREKLAYLVDSTAAPVAGLSLISTWIAVELTYLAEGLAATPEAAALSIQPLDLFMACIPYRFYVIQALLLVAMVAILDRDLGPMARAERREAHRREGDAPTADETDHGWLSVEATHWCYAVVPLAAMLATVLGLLLITGKQSAADRIAGLGPGLGHLAWMREVFGAADSNLALQYGGMVGVAVAWLMTVPSGILTGERFRMAAGKGAISVLPAILILWMAGSMSRMTSNRTVEGEPAPAFAAAADRLYTGEFLKDQLLAFGEATGSATLLAGSLPTVVFLLASALAFSTGTSFGTMGILVPIVVPLSFASLDLAGLPADLGQPLLLGSVGAVLAGAIFGDHCSPISDTTILSSQASGCNHMAHVDTQMPYALLAMGASVLLGTMPLAFGISVWLLLPLQAFATFAVLYSFGGKNQVETEPPDAH